MSDENKPAAKRFYEQASAVETEAGFAVHLDDRPVRTPLGQPFVVPTKSLADAIVAEWQAQGDTIDPTSMPICGFANTAIDRIGKERDTITATLLKYAETDLLCYRADQPEELATRQSEQWQPLLDWAGETFQANFQVTAGVLPIDQSTETMQALNNAIAELDDMELTAVASLAAACGSLVLALALEKGRITPHEAFQLSQLDELFQSERWGLDSEAEARLDKLERDMASAAHFLALLRQ